MQRRPVVHLWRVSVFSSRRDRKAAQRPLIERGSKASNDVSLDGRYRSPTAVPNSFIRGSVAIRVSASTVLSRSRLRWLRISSGDKPVRVHSLSSTSGPGVSLMSIFGPILNGTWLARRPLCRASSEEHRRRRLCQGPATPNSAVAPHFVMFDCSGGCKKPGVQIRVNFISCMISAP